MGLRQHLNTIRIQKIFRYSKYCNIFRNTGRNLRKLNFALLKQNGSNVTSLELTLTILNISFLKQLENIRLTSFKKKQEVLTAVRTQSLFVSNTEVFLFSINYSCAVNIKIFLHINRNHQRVYVTTSFQGMQQINRASIHRLCVNHPIYLIISLCLYLFKLNSLIPKDVRQYTKVEYNATVQLCTQKHNSQ